ncbi:hypothetical protein CGZ93_06160 [Enemella dayhoffiae]|uniref:Sucrase ferredoxin n=1 Tax=Enemella dayhoffiae TaxID=2016507 RepID=A0A255H773_9ACTN|nr:sucrase ferredoxin [Enemella dayhoffiae]OYO23515.1 hypothetical protein CGZ93_06160 [Enemella dayhoffiae]
MSSPKRPADFACSTAARARGDQLVGTAPPARRWFLVEQPGGWGATAWAGLDVAAPMKDLLQGVLNLAEARLMLIRRPGHGRDTVTGGGRRRWCVVDPLAPRRVRWGVADSDADVLRAAELFAGANPELNELEPVKVSPGEPELLMVCTHGRKDVCCATRGRPVAARAAELWPEATWECTHTGGDRFAGNLLLLPDGACYGGIDPESVEAIVRAHVAGRVDPTQLRGPTGHPAWAQAAAVAAYRQMGPLRWDQVHPISEESDGEQWRVVLDVDEVLVEVTGHQRVTEADFLTCKADLPKRMLLAVVDDLRPLAAVD